LYVFSLRSSVNRFFCLSLFALGIFKTPLLLVPG
jgi:hypothetical protein